MTIALERPSAEPAVPRMVWLDLTRKCQLACTHCLNDSGRDGSHGEMTLGDWMRAIAEIAALRVPKIQFFGGEPTLHPHFMPLVGAAVLHGLAVEVYTNLVHPPSSGFWYAAQTADITLATSYYSDDPGEHDAITGRRSHARTRANIINAVERGVRLRVGIVRVRDQQRVDQARAELEALGVTDIRLDDARPFGRSAQGRVPDVANLCGNCGDGKAAIGPDGQVTPCVFADWLTVGDVRSTPLAGILAGSAMAEATAAIRSAPSVGTCDPDGDCSPGGPDSGCSPQA